ncbi:MULTISPECIES: hypothetical protein [Malaciobacter]|jgi:hypothetical protein|uniref:Uncharacterized protein n=2 Tax=Malaciobacter TaxID=2321114 RepID=A0A1T5D2T0_9BACT|nr:MULTISPECIES: hypothetical protein [Malaciobacter]AXX87105.1 hypothetical protein AMRN_1369 [Malaciobacter marinus]PHO08866.1 hypothetical protein CPG37_12445 [Malaciobacter canalis]PHO12306.1 hypothetical protein CPG38_08645 [Malaciobacter marinus]PHO16315.1 hypothetical protein CPH92_02295 [Malaciobacter marinus]QEE32898.1 hypothetical protein ACAN_1422 [Malaciobacter canalis]
MQNNNPNEIIIDEWDLKLEEALKGLKQCQNSKELESCKSCSLFFECELRKKYVLAVYESMNKGSGGGFEF